MPGPVLLKHPVHTNKDEPLVEEAELLQANPQYAHVWYSDGRETTVSLHRLAPLPEDTFIRNNILPEPNIQVDSCSLPSDEPLNVYVYIYIKEETHLKVRGGGGR